MAKRPKRPVSLRAAVAAALLIFLHTYLTALTAGAHASPAQLDAFGNPLCHTALGFDGGDGTPGDDRSCGNCCAFGCHFAAAAPLPERVPVLLAFRPSAVVVWRLRESPSRPGLYRSSIQPRGPPRFV